MSDHETAAIIISGLTDQTIDLGHIEVHAPGLDTGLLIEDCHDVHVVLPRRIVGSQTGITANRCTGLILDRLGHDTPCDMGHVTDLLEAT